MRRRQYLTTGTGLVAASALGATAAAQDNETDGDGGKGGGGEDDGAEFSTFVQEVEAAFGDINATVISFCDCPRISEFVVTTRGEDTNDDAFQEELTIVAEVYASFVNDAEEPPAFGVAAYVYESDEAATESITDPFATYSIQTGWAEDRLEAENSEEYLTQIMETVSPPIEMEEEQTGEASQTQIAIAEHELIHDDSGFTTETYVEAVVQNTGDGPTGRIALEASWYSEGDYMDADTAYLRTLGAGETWLARVYFLGSGNEDVDDYKLAHETEPEPPTASDGLELADSELQVGEDDVVVSGRIENNTGAEQSYIQAIAKLYDADGVVLGTTEDTVTDLPEGETWAFEATWFTLADVDAVDDYEVIISNRV